MSAKNPFPNTKPMKERELRAAAVCANCGEKIGACGMPLFYRVTIERHGVDIQSVTRQTGLALMLGGNGAIASVMGPDEDMTIPLMDSATITICESCAGQPMTVHELGELVNQAAQKKEKTPA